MQKNAKSIVQEWFKCMRNSNLPAEEQPICMFNSSLNHFSAFQFWYWGFELIFLKLLRNYLLDSKTMATFRKVNEKMWYRWMTLETWRQTRTAKFTLFDKHHLCLGTLYLKLPFSDFLSLLNMFTVFVSSTMGVSMCT